MDERRPLIEEIQVSSSIKDIAVDEGELIVNRTTVIEEKLNFPNPKTIHDVFEHGKIKPAKALVYLKPFYKVLIIAALFYMLPSVQFVFFQYQTKEVSCYYNFKCKHDFWFISAFNNVISNIGYIAAGVSFIIIVKLTKPVEDGLHGLHTDMSLFYCMGLALIFEGIFSALYHVCPSKLNFQFDTTFMFAGALLLFVCIYQKRQHSLSPGPFCTFSMLVIVIILNFLSLVSFPPYVFWPIVFVLWTYFSLFGSYHMLYHHRMPICKPRKILRTVRRQWHGDKARLTFVLVGNAVAYTVLILSAGYGITISDTLDFPTICLGLLVLVDLMYLVWYTVMKFRHGERPPWFVWIVWLNCLSITSGALYFFQIPVTNKFLSFDESKKLNKPCFAFDYFDTHDVWHFLSAIALFLLFSTVYIMDRDIIKRERKHLNVF
jgi:hypothetical protein